MKQSKDSLINWFSEESCVEPPYDIFVPPLDCKKISNIPGDWVDVLSGKTSPVEFVSAYWGKSGEFPELTETLQSRLVGLGLLVKDKQPKLLYIFHYEGSIAVFIGDPPIKTIPKEHQALYEPMKSTLAIHNGFLDASDEMTGLIPFDSLETIELEEESSEDFLGVFNVGANWLGFDLSKTPAKPYILWDHCEVEEVDSFNNELDSWLATQLEEFDKI